MIPRPQRNMWDVHTSPSSIYTTPQKRAALKTTAHCKGVFSPLRACFLFFSFLFLPKHAKILILLAIKWHPTPNPVHIQKQQLNGKKVARNLSFQDNELVHSHGASTQCSDGRNAVNVVRPFTFRPPEFFRGVKSVSQWERQSALLLPWQHAFSSCSIKKKKKNRPRDM